MLADKKEIDENHKIEMRDFINDKCQDKTGRVSEGMFYPDDGQTIDDVDIIK